MRKAKKEGMHKQLLLHVSEVNWDYETVRIINWLRDTGARMAYVDLFCGAGGTTSGVEQAYWKGFKLGCVVLGINHDRGAIASHQANHPHTLHLVEDVCEVNLIPIARLIAAIREALPYIKIVLWASAECTNHSKAKGGDARDADSRSLPEELYRYIQALRPDYIQIENVMEFRIWGPIIHKNINIVWNKKKRDYFPTEHKTIVTGYPHKIRHAIFGRLYSKNGQKWFAADGSAYSKDKEKGIVPWLIPDKRYLAQYFNEWRDHIKSLGYPLYDDRDINSASMGAVTARTRYFGQFSTGAPIMWPEATHVKKEKLAKMDPAIWGKLKPYRAVREVLDLQDTGQSIFDPNRKKAIESDKTFDRIFQGCMRFVPGGAERYDFLVKFNSTAANGDTKHSVSSIDNACPVVSTHGRLAKASVTFLTSYHAGEGKEGRTHSIDEPCRTVDTQNRYAPTVIDVLPFLVQYNNNCDANDVNNPCPPVLVKDKHYLANAKFMVDPQWSTRNGTPAKDIDNPAMTIMANGSTPSLVNAEQILPFISMYYGNGHNCHTVDGVAPTVMGADNGALATPEPFIMRYFSNGGGQHNDVNGPAGGMTTVPKMHLVTPEEIQWIMNPSYDNVGSTVDQPAHTILGGRKHAYLLDAQFGNAGASVEKPSPTIIARQDKKPLHLVQVEQGDESFFGIVIYESDSESVRRLKRFMAANGIVDIKMRMLHIHELLKIQGFPSGYVLKGNQTEQKKFIGNSVEVTTAMKLVECYGAILYAESNIAACA